MQQAQLPQIYYIIFTAVTAAGVLLQAFVLLAMYLALREATKKFHQLSQEFHQHVLPTLATTRLVLEDVSPKLKVVATNLLETSNLLRLQANHVNDTVDTILDKTNAQVERIDEMFSGALTTVSHATAAVEHAAAVPIRRISGIVAGIRAGFDVLFHRDVVEVSYAEPTAAKPKTVTVPIETVDLRGEERVGGTGPKSVSVSQG